MYPVVISLRAGKGEGAGAAHSRRAAHGSIFWIKLNEESIAELLASNIPDADQKLMITASNGVTSSGL